MTKTIVIGGTGYAGAAIASEASRRGNEVTALSRTAPSVPLEGVTYETADVTSQIPSFDGADVVVAALSPRGSNAGTLRDVYSKLASAAADAGARFVAVGGFSSLRPAVGAPRFADGGGCPTGVRRRSERDECDPR